MHDGRPGRLARSAPSRDSPSGSLEPRLAELLNFIGIRTYADLREVEVAQKPEGWDGKDLSKVKRVDLRGRNLAFADCSRRLPRERRPRARPDAPSSRRAPTLTNRSAPSSRAPTSARPAPGRRPRRAQLQGADLQPAAQLQGADLRTTPELQGADLTDAQLQGADLSGAELQGADLQYAQLQGADLSAALRSRALDARQAPSSRAPTSAAPSSRAPTSAAPSSRAPTSAERPCGALWSSDAAIGTSPTSATAPLSR